MALQHGKGQRLAVGQSELPAWQVKSLMEQTCTDLGPPVRDTTFCAGLLNAREAVRAAKRNGK